MNFCGSRRFDHFFQLFFCLFDPGHIFKCYRRLVAGEHAGARFAERHGGVVAALRLAEDKPEHTRQDDKR
jgi:hypothetical protein